MHPFQVEAFRAEHVGHHRPDRLEGGGLVTGVAGRQSGEPVGVLHRLGSQPIIVERLQALQGGAHFFRHAPDQAPGARQQLRPATRDRDQTVEVAIGRRRVQQGALANAGAR